MHFDHYLRFLTDKSWQDPRLHFHDSYEILFSLTDAGKMFACGELFPLKEGMIFFFSPGELHRVVCDVDEFERFVLHISDDFFIQFMQEENLSKVFPEPFGYILAKGENYDQLQTLFSRLYTLEQQKEPNESLIIITFLELTYQLMSLASTSMQEGVPIPNVQLNKIRPIIKYIQQNITEPLSLDDIAGKFFINKYYICHLFKEATNFTITEFIVKNRLAMARKYLRDGKTVQETCELCGFQSYTHFIRSFTKDMGISPGKYSRKYEEYHKI